MYELQEIKIRGKVYPAVFNVAALKEVGARYGGLKELGEKLREDYGKTVEEFSWIIALLIKHGIALKNFEEGTNDQALTQEQIELVMSPGELFTQQVAILDIINTGMGAGTGTKSTEEEEEVDEVLEEVLKTKNGEDAKGK